MLPILASIASMLAGKGLDLLSSAIDGGADKAKGFIEEKTGIELDGKKELTGEEVAKLKELEVTSRLELEKLALENKREDNRHEEHYVNVEVSDKQSARAATHLEPTQSRIADKVYVQSSWSVPMLLLLNALLVVFAPVMELDTAAIVGLGNLVGIALSNQYRERQSILEYYFGASIDKEK